MTEFSPFNISSEKLNFSFTYFLLLIVFGLSLGSFAHATAQRIVTNCDILFIRSSCPYCKKKLKWWMIIPLISFIYLKGMCSFCFQKINVSYLLSEIFLSIVIVSYFALYNPFDAIFLSFLSTAFLICFITDWKSMNLHLPIMFLIIIFGIIYNICQNDTIFINFFNSIVGALSGAILIFIISKLYKILRGENGFGEGDIWLLAGSGSLYNIDGVLIIFFISVLTSAIYGLFLMSFGQINYKGAIPFGSFLSITSIIYPFIQLVNIIA